VGSFTAPVYGLGIFKLIGRVSFFSAYGSIPPFVKQLNRFNVVTMEKSLFVFRRENILLLPLPFVYGDPDEGQHSGRTGVHQPYF
jgi:hypothetical protein